MDLSAPVWQLQAELLKYQSQLKEIELKMNEPNAEKSELEGLAADMRDIISAYKEMLLSKGVKLENMENSVLQKNVLVKKEQNQSGANPGPTLKTIAKKPKKSKGRKEEALKERVQSWQQFHSKHGARRKSIFQSPEEGSRTRVGFQGSPGTLTAIPERKKHEFVNINEDS
ncbi:hypothetical protein GpartN1_g3355.t1 [Galdieria partita]|uniref:Uncharacterized protein n=1 Tax=Galdieria partita TaxID=83374 RepID=A0A9C7PW90_9RHOD|nr:hypothetical protein GpartN1_g3355.t1 [Galdieria partita]